jgi:hypothetical protein
MRISVLGEQARQHRALALVIGISAQRSGALAMMAEKAAGAIAR